MADAVAVALAAVGLVGFDNIIEAWRAKPGQAVKGRRRQ
jgi:hypothetical protein